MALDTGPLCFFHRNCLDGRCAAAIVRRAWPGVTCIGLQPGWEPPVVRGRRLAIVDLGFPVEVMRRLAAEATELVWCDHHASWRATAEALGFGSFDEAECGATLAWRHFFPGQEPPAILAHVHDRDCWRNALPESAAVCAGLDHHFSDERIIGLLEADPAEMAACGRILLAERERRLAKALAHAIVSRDPYGLMGQRALVLNQPDLVSEIGDVACRDPAQGGQGCDLCICFQADRSGRWLHSLRSAGGVDCRRIAEARGGGGHPNAAAYVADEPFPLSQDCLDWP
jgi:hypothetical protein